jgi:hypothetical protein
MVLVCRLRKVAGRYGHAALRAIDTDYSVEEWSWRTGIPPVDPDGCSVPGAASTTGCDDKGVVYSEAIRGKGIGRARWAARCGIFPAVSL